MTKVALVVVFMAIIIGLAVFLLGRYPKTLSRLSPVVTPNIVNQKVPSQEVKKQKEPSRVVLIATGDVVPGRSVNYQMVTYNNFEWPFEKVKNVLASGDITMVNFEVPLVKNCPTVVEGMVFCGREEAVKGLVASGVDVVTLANNHISDYGMAGIENTIRIMRENGISTVGYSAVTTDVADGVSEEPRQPNQDVDEQNSQITGEILYKTVNGTKFAFLAFNDIYGSIPPILSAEREVIERLVGEARKNSDVVVVAMHWGVEYRAEPDDRQIELAHLVADAGADLIIGNHPHWIQSEERHKNTYIKYAHGNLVFDQMWSEETKKGVIGKYTFEDGKLVAKEFIPTYIKDYGQPEIVD